MLGMALLRVLLGRGLGTGAGGAQFDFTRLGGFLERLELGVVLGSKSGDVDLQVMDVRLISDHRSEGVQHRQDARERESDDD